ncbi:ptplb-prov protein [Capsaspora owczarzaki ATCC 30864]|nr:ptplb-prov protein [Capsaspora owczarzaki ATCC 30864]|eukprot:XP_004349858.1 ptplb-prov protein [Capsaspora owczarzaki ATCC 30864]
MAGPSSTAAAPAKKPTPLPVKLYLAAYNLVQAAGWSYILYLMIDHYFVQQKSYNTLYPVVEQALAIFQTGAILEIIHAIVRFVKSPVAITFVQVYSRVFLVWGIAHSVPETQPHWAFTLMLTAWTVTEIIRYLYYFFNLFGSVPYILTWCRYTFFYVLYPMGVSGEVIMIFQAMPVVERNKLFSTELPNWYNFSFSYYYFLIVMAITYVPGFPPLYQYMIKQRRTIIGGKTDKRKSE